MEPIENPEAPIRSANDPLSAPAVMQPRSIREAQILASELSKSDLVPSSLQGKADSVLLIIMDAISRGRNVLTHLRSRYVVQGNLGVSAAALIAEMNSSGYFKGVVTFEWENQGTPDLTCTCSAITQTDQKVSVTFALATAIKAGWTSYKNGRPKENWDNLPEQMCAYRAATFFARLYCPTAVIGLTVEDEMDQVTQTSNDTSADASRAAELAAELGEPKDLEPVAHSGRGLFQSPDPAIEYD